jgi:putative ubiquitin-RnfH superfamily antitoxin RatB of RatAB toxin-antitoxin module
MKRCTIACDTPAGLQVCELALPDDATVGDALTAARTVLGERSTDWSHASTGIFGRLRPHGYCWADGDRIEIYRPLQVDPRASRRARAGRGR